MKKITWLTFICAALLGILVLCCTNGLSPDSTVKGDGVEAGDQLTISIHADENLAIFSEADVKRKARTISSDAFVMDGSDGNTLKFYLYGKATNGTELLPKEVNVKAESEIKGIVTLDIDCYNWELTLAAVEGDLPSSDFGGATSYDDQTAYVKANAVLIGSATVDMVFTNSIDFTISPKGLTKLGSVALTIAREDDWQIPDGYVVTAGIYNITTKEEIEVYDSSTSTDPNTTGTNIQTLEDFTAPGTTAEANHFVSEGYTVPSPYDDDNATYTANGKYLKPGTYLFEIQLNKTGENRAYVWNDTIIVLPGKQSNMINVLNSSGGKDTAQLLVIPNLIGVIPDEPTSLTVTPSAPDVDAPGYYSATFNWVATNVTTETNFALEIIEIKAELDGALTDFTTLAVGDDTWADLMDTTKYCENYYIFDYLHDLRKDPRFYKDGSLFANNTTVTVLLELGKRYVARLRSENNAGYSEEAAYIATSGKYTPINKYRVTYHLQGGTWDTSNAYSAGPTIDQIVYNDLSTSYAVIAPTGVDNPDYDPTDSSTHKLMGSAATPYLHDGVANWAYWTQGLNGDKYPSSSADSYVPEAYTGFANLDLYAKYSREGGVTIYDDNDYDIFDNYVTGLSQDGNPTTIVKDAKITVSKGKTQTETDATTGHDGEHYTEVSVTLPTGSETWKYDKVIFEVTYGGRTYVADEQVGAARGTANTFKFYLQNFQAGYVYNCKITAHYQRTVVSYPFAMYLTD